MQLIDRIAYNIKNRAPSVYSTAERCTRWITVTAYGNSIKAGRAASRIEGEIAGEPAVMRYIDETDVDAFMEMLLDIPEKYIEYFHPHGLDCRSLQTVLARKDIMTYGLFIDERMVAYALLKLFFNKNAYSGRLVHPSMGGRGIGKFLARYTSWQAWLMGFDCYSTNNWHNAASLQSNSKARPFEIKAQLPNGYMLLKYPVQPAHRHPPQLQLPSNPPGLRSP